MEHSSCTSEERIAIILPTSDNTTTGGQRFNEVVANILEGWGARVIRIGNYNTSTPRGITKHVISRSIHIPQMIRSLRNSHEILYLSPSGPAENAVVLIHHSLKSWHKTEESIGYRPSALARAKRSILEIMENISAKTASQIIVPSHTAKRDISKDYGVPKEKITVVRQGVDKNLFKPPEEKEEPTNDYFFAPNIFASPVKGAELLIKAYSAAVDAGLDIPLIITSDAVPRWGQELLSKTGKESRALIKIQKRIPLSELPNYYWNARAVLYPSLYEGYGRIPIEALASGAIVLANDSIPASTDIKSWATILKPDPSVWEKALLDLRSDQKVKHLRQVAKRGIATIPTWEDTAKAILDAITGGDI